MKKSVMLWFMIIVSCTNPNMQNGLDDLRWFNIPDNCDLGSASVTDATRLNRIPVAPSLEAIVVCLSPGTRLFALWNVIFVLSIRL